jgi:hypothetical protein
MSSFVDIKGLVEIINKKIKKDLQNKISVV